MSVDVKGQLAEDGLLLSHVGSRDRTQVIRLVANAFNHWAICMALLGKQQPLSTPTQHHTFHLIE